MFALIYLEWNTDLVFGIIVINTPFHGVFIRKFKHAGFYLPRSTEVCSAWPTVIPCSCPWYPLLAQLSSYVTCPMKYRLYFVLIILSLHIQPMLFTFSYKAILPTPLYDCPSAGESKQGYIFNIYQYLITNNTTSCVHVSEGVQHRS